MSTFELLEQLNELTEELELLDRKKDLNEYDISYLNSQNKLKNMILEKLTERGHTVIVNMYRERGRVI